MSKILFAILCFVSTAAFAQIDPVDQDPNLGHYIPTAPTGFTQFVGQIAGPRSPSSPVAAFGVISSVMPGNSYLQVNNGFLGGSIPFTTTAGSTTQVNVPAVTFCGSYYSPHQGTTHVDLLARAMSYDITDVNGQKVPSVATLGLFGSSPACMKVPQLATAGHYSIQLRFNDAQNPPTADLPVFKPLAFDVAPAGMTTVTGVEEELRAQLTNVVTGKASFAMASNTYSGTCRPRFGNVEKHVYVAAKPVVIDHAANQRSKTYEVAAMSEAAPLHVWPLSPTSQFRYYVSVAGISQPLAVSTSGQVIPIETKIVNVNDVFIKTSIPGKQDYYVAGQIMMNAMDPVTRAPQSAVGFQSYNTTGGAYDACASASTSFAGAVATFPTKRSFELLPGLYNVVITYTHPEEQKKKKQVWELDCTATGLACTGKLVSEGPALN